MRLNDALLGILLLGLAAALYTGSRGFPDIPGQRYGAALFPTIIAIGFLGCGLVLIASGLRARARLVTFGDWARDPRGLVNVLATIGAIVLYIALSDRLGFVPTLAPILVVLLRLFGVGWALSIALAILVPIGMHWLFGRLLLVPLPWGILAPWRLW